MAGLCALALWFWTGHPAAAQPALTGEQASRIETALAAAPDHGFARGAFGEDRAKALLASPDPARQAEGRAELVQAVLAYASAQHGQRLAASDYLKNWAIRPEPYDPRPEFEAALAAGRLDEWLAALPPSDPGYRRLQEAYRRYRELAATGGWPSVPAKSAPGDSGPAVAALRARLAAEDPTTPADAAVPYDDALKAAVAKAQTRLGLAADGVAGSGTVAALNVSPADRAAQIAANLERRRWMPRAEPPVRAEVNIADASLTLHAPNAAPLGMRIIVGQPNWQTPMFLDHIVAVVLNPPWNVPESIARKEVWPKIRRNPGYMARERFVVKPGGGLQQKPGPRCALGLIKFDLDNSFGVYLHDTPSRGLFAQSVRTLSHGCMRLELPNDLARRLLQDDPQWTPETIQAAIDTGKTVRINLRQPPTLYVGYWTVLAGEDGAVQFRPDVYGWDRTLLTRLGGTRTAAR